MSKACHNGVTTAKAGDVFELRYRDYKVAMYTRPTLGEACMVPVGIPRQRLAPIISIAKFGSVSRMGTYVDEG